MKKTLQIKFIKDFENHKIDEVVTTSKILAEHLEKKGIAKIIKEKKINKVVKP